MLPSDIYFEAAHFLQSPDFARLEATSIDHKTIVAKAVQHQATTLYGGGDHSARFEQESWPRLAQFLEARARVQASKGGQPTIAGGGSERHAYSAVISSGGELYTFGASSDGCLGHGGDDDFEYDDHVAEQRLPTQVMALASTRIVSVAAGETHLVAVAASGGVFTFGAGRHGALGHGDLKMRNVPTIVESLKGVHVISASAGFSTSAAVSSDGSLYTWGSSWFGDDHIGPLGHERPHSDRELELVPRKVERLEPHFAVSSACGNGSTSVLTREGKVLSMGGVSKNFMRSSAMSDYVKRVIQGVVSKPRVVPLSEFDARAVHISVTKGLQCHTVNVVLQSGHIYAVPVNPAAAALSNYVSAIAVHLDGVHHARQQMARLGALLTTGGLREVSDALPTVDAIMEKAERQFIECHEEALKAAGDSGGGGGSGSDETGPDWRRQGSVGHLGLVMGPGGVPAIGLSAGRLGLQHKFSDENVGSMLCSIEHSSIFAVVSELGALFTAGYPMAGLLGHDLQGAEAWEPLRELRQVKGLHRHLIDSKRVVSVASGQSHTLILTSCGELYTCGGLECGSRALGYAPTTDAKQGGGTNVEYGSAQQNVPRKVDGLPVLMT